MDFVASHARYNRFKLQNEMQPKPERTQTYFYQPGQTTMDSA